MHVVGDVAVAGDQHLATKAHGDGSREHTTADDARPVTDLERDVVAMSVERLQPRTAADEDVAPDGDSLLASQPDRELDDASPAECRERAPARLENALSRARTQNR